MNIPSLLGILSGIISLSAYIPYIRAIVKKETRPSFISWPIWLLSLSLIFATSYSSGARNTLFMIGAGILGNVIISILAFKYGKKIWTRLDIFAIIISVASLIIWIITGNALIALAMNVIIDCVAYFPTFQNILRDPHSENQTAWTLFWIGAIINVLVLCLNHTFARGIVLFPMIYLGTTSFTMLLLWYRKNF